MTVATDYVLAALSVGWGVGLLRRRHRAAKLWGCAFLAMAAGAALGGTAHGFPDALGPAGLAAAWKATQVAIGVASFFLLAATGAGLLSCRGSRLLAAAAGVKMALYVAWIASHNEFVWVIADYGASMVVVLALHAWAWRARRLEWAGWIAAGVLVSFAAAGIQVGGLSLHRHFNHNDLYHVVQMFGLWLFRRGAAGVDILSAARRTDHGGSSHSARSG